MILSNQTNGLISQFNMIIKSLIPQNYLSKIVKNKLATMARSFSSEPNDVIFEEVKNKGVIILNRPKALNSLNLSMVRKINPILKKWEKEKSCVIVKGAGEKAFCAGGDVKALVLDGLKGGKLGNQFFYEEYLMNGIIGTYGIPYISLIDGIVMGGGVGISVHGHYRVATEKTVFAMPEMQIGLHPDVGGSYFLPRLGGRLGWYLALTGHRLTGSDVFKAGIATHYCNSKDLNELESALIDSNGETELHDNLNKFSVTNVKEFSLAPYMKQINECFLADTVEEIINKLEKDGSQWAKDTLKILNVVSPTSLKLTVKLLNEGSKLDLCECLKIEYRVSVGCLTHKDFFEGVRALLIDKDQKPKWNPSKLEDVTDKYVEEHFQKLPEDQELKHKL